MTDPPDRSPVGQVDGDVSDAAAPTLAGEPPAAARLAFGDRLPLAERYAAMLAAEGVAHGHIGPREIPRLWPRHLLNSVVLAELVGEGERIVDVGSGAGLPGIPLAICRPDIRVTLVESMQRRCGFLTACVDALGLTGQVDVVRGRAEDPAVVAQAGDADCVVARAVAPLDRLAQWCLPLVVPGGRVLALKGSSAEAELAATRGTMARLGVQTMEIRQLGGADSDAVTWVVVLERGANGRRCGAADRRRKVSG